MHRPPLLCCALAVALLHGCDESHDPERDADLDRAADEREAGWYEQSDDSFGTTMLDAGKPIRMVDSSKPTGASAPRPVDAGSATSNDFPTQAEHGSFATALRIVPDGSHQIVDEFDEAQVDYFVFTAEAGGFYEIATDNGRFSPDNVLALYDAEQQLIAENDIGSLWPGDAYDTRLVVRVPKAGDYYVRVEDLVTPADFFRQSFALLYYELSVRPVSGATPGYASAGSASPPVFLDDEMLGYHYVTVLGEFDQDAEVVEFEGLANQALIAQVHPGGVHGDGSSVSDGQLSVSSSAGATLAAIDRARKQTYFRPPISSGKHRISLSRSGERGSNPFFVMDLVMLPDNPSEQQESQNGKLEGAETVTLSGGARGRGLLLARVGKGDLDHYRVDAVEGQTLSVSCEGESTGSGVRGLTAELRDAANGVLGSAKEAETGLDVSHEVARAGTYYLRLSSEEASGTAADPWVRCAVLLN